MEITYNQCDEILKTLPIGLYTGRRIPLRLSNEEKTSLYSPMEDTIIISYPVIAERMKQTAEGTCDNEEAVRSMVYHEVSHAILTPPHAHDWKEGVMEDERIETVLRRYYHGVDFRKQIYDIHGGHAPKPTNAKSAFFNAVRFGLGTGRVQKKVNQILKNFAPMNRNTGWYREYDSKGNDYSIGKYQTEIEELWKMVEKDYKDDPNSFMPPPEGKNQKQEQGGKGMQQMDSVSTPEEKEEKEEKKNTGSGKDDKDGTAEEETPAKGEGKNDPSDDSSEQEQPYPEPHECPAKNDDVQKIVREGLKMHPKLSDEQVEKLDKFQKQVEIIISNFNKKNSGGSGINAYSGVFSPRAVTRQDYRYFERSMSTQGNNKFGSCHLTLLIDCSGSFCYNVDITNGILRVLSEVERKNRNFSMDVAFINESLYICESVAERNMKASGGNDIPDDIKETLLKLQKPQTCNYNIILFDGDAFSDHWGGHETELFRAFDMKQTTLITDPANEEYMSPPFASTKVVVTKDYTQKLIDNVLHALIIAFG